MPTPSERPSKTRADASRFDEPSADDSGPTGTLRDSSSRGTRRVGSESGPPQAGESFAGFTIGERIGRGAMGLVYRARDAADRDVALKVILGHQADADGIARFVREGQAMASIPAHPNVVRVLSAGKERGLPWLAMDFVEGTTLKHRIKHGPLPVDEARLIAHRLAEALAHIHASGVVHRDLKPANVILRGIDGEPLLTDFGLARMQGAQRLTLSGDVLGTPVYMSPEQILGLKHEVDAQSDVWALGVLLYEMLAGQPPFLGANLTEMAQLITTTEPRPIRSLRGDVHSDLARAINGALSKPKEHRYPNAAAFADALDAVPDRADSDGALPRSRSRTGSFTSGVNLPRARKQAIRLGLGLAILAAVVLGIGVFVRSRLRGANVEALQAELSQLDREASRSLPGLLGEKVKPGSVEALAERLATLEQKRDAAGVPLDLSKVQDAIRRGRITLALGSQDWTAATDHAEATADAQQQTILRARVAVARSAEADMASLEALKDSKSAELASAARILLARILLAKESDPAAPAAAKALLNERVSRKAAEADLRRADLLLMIDASESDGVSRLLGRVPKHAKRPAWVRGFRLVQARLRPPAPPEPLTKALRTLVPLAPHADPRLLAPEGPPLARQVLLRIQSLEKELLGSLSRSKRGRRAVAMAQVVRLTLALADSGLQPPWPERADQRNVEPLSVYKDLTNKLLYMQRDDTTSEQFVRLLHAFVQLDMPVPGSALTPTTRNTLHRLPDGPHKAYLLVRRRLINDSRYPSPPRKKLNVMLAQRDAFGQHHRAFMLAHASLWTGLEPARALSMAREAARLDPLEPDSQYALVVALARAGEHQELMPALKRLETEQGLELRGKRAVAFAYAYLGDQPKTERWLGALAVTDHHLSNQRWIEVTKADVLHVLRGALLKKKKKKKN